MTTWIILFHLIFPLSGTREPVTPDAADQISAAAEAEAEAVRYRGLEQMFAKFKALLRRAAARTREALWTTIGQLLDRFSPDECRNYLTHSGYAFE